jgi:hypothetical protein
MKYAGLLVMPTGFFLAVAALILFPEAGLRAMFVACGLAVEVLGLGVAVRGHMERRPDLQAVPHPVTQSPPGSGAARGATRR